MRFASLRGVSFALIVSVSVLSIVLPHPAQAELAVFRQSVAEAASGSEAVATFYRERNFAPLWTTSADVGRRAALFEALDRAADHGLPASKYDAAGLRAAFRDTRTERQRGALDVRMTETFLAFAQDLRNGVLTPAEVDPGIVREVPRLADLDILRAFSAADPAAYIRALPPSDVQYGQLMKARRDLTALIEQGGWGPRVTAGALRPGDTGAGVVALRDRLEAMGYLPRSVGQSFDAAMEKAVQQFQTDNGMTPDGVADEATLTEINRGPEERLASVLVAMERMRWMNGLPLGRRYIWANLPDFTAKIIDDGKVTFETITVVGMNAPDRRSPEFSDQMEFMVINPTWNVPRSITVREYLPLLKRDPNAVGQLRIVDRNGRQVDRGAVDFTQFTERNFPFSMSQPPSDDNALGLVKFMFPNPNNIYMHDTPSKSLFKKEIRAFSHGCIRLARPFEFAYALLAAQTDDPIGLFERHLKTRAENTLTLTTPVPVHLVYFTAWPDARGKIAYRRDVYGRDGRIFDALAGAGVVLPEVRG